MFYWLNRWLALFGTACLFLPIPESYALDQILRPYQSVRSASMGGVRIITGLYDENFFNNPARVTANPSSKLTLLQITPFEVTQPTLDSGKDLLSGSNPLGTIANSSGNNIHDRFQLILPAYYLASSQTRKWALAFGIIASIQTDADMRKSYQMTMGAIGDVGPALTFGWKLLKNDALSVGATGHFSYRVGMAPNYGLLDYVRGVPLTASAAAGDGSMVSVDLGATYLITKWHEFNFNVGGAIQNALGSNYSTSLLTLINKGNLPPSQPRSYGIGFSVTREEWWKLTQTTFAIEATDVLNNAGGSIFRLLHLGAETHWKSFSFRTGLNQGYLSGGIGLDVRYFTLNLGTYGEEMSLNAGGLEDRRYTVDLGIHI